MRIKNKAQREKHRCGDDNASTLTYCYAHGNMTSYFLVDGDNLPREDRKVLLSGCGMFPPTCIGDVTGAVGDMFGTPVLKNPSINWTAKPSS